MNARLFLLPWVAILALVLGPAVGRAAEEPSAPSWGADELRSLFSRIQLSGQAARVEEKDAELANVAGLAYRVERQRTESTDLYAKRVLKARKPTHPTVKTGQWLTALMSVFYADVAERCALLARFEKTRQDRAYFDQMGREAKGVATVLAKEVQTSFEGVQGFVAPLPVASAGCVDPEPYGASATVRAGKVSIENIDRAEFKDDVPPADAPRTGGGALREFFAAQRQYNVSAEMLGNYDTTWRKNRGRIRVTIPAASPAIYLNELVRGGVEAGMHTLIILAVDSKNALCEVRLPIGEPKAKKGKAAKKTLKIGVARCADDAPMQKCVDHLIEERRAGPIRFDAG